MSLTVVAHCCSGSIISPFPKELSGFSGEGSFTPFRFHGKERGDFGGFLMVAYETDDIEMLVSAFREHLANNSLTFLAEHRTGESHVCYSWCAQHLF